MAFEFSGDGIRKIGIYSVVMCVAIPFGGYYGMVYWDNGIAGITVGIVLGTTLTALGLTIMRHSAGIFGLLAGERSACYTMREQLESDMQQARYQKVNKDFDLTLRKVNTILQKDPEYPEYPEALFLKAQIVWEGFGNRASAVSNLKAIHSIVKDRNSTIYRWAGSLLDEIEQKS